VDYSEAITGIVVPILLALVTALIAWIWSLWAKVSHLELQLAKNYHDKDELDKTLEDKLSPILKSIVRIEGVLDRAFPQGAVAGHGAR